MTVTRRRIAAISILLLAASALAQTKPPQRRNIDCLSGDQLNTYRHAFEVLKARNPADDAKADVYHRSYSYYVSLHNGDGVISACNHGSELFLPWHRALLLVFERALQEADPANGTRDIMLPYWDWTHDPSGSRYPKPFEVRGDVLFAPRKTTQPQKHLYSAAEIEQVIQDSRSWPVFGGGSCNDDPNCGTTGYGALEDPYHNQMHNWVGGAMTSDTRAAIDPIFWSFHDFIDLIFDRWQKAHPGERLGCLNCPFKGMTDWTPAKVSNVADIGYEYDLTSCGPPSPRRAKGTLVPEARAIAEAKPKKSMAAGPVIVDVTIPEDTFTTAEVRVGGAEIPQDFSYRGAVYLYPASAKLSPTDEAFRQRYLVGTYSVWALHHGEHHAAETDLYVDATTELRYLAKKYSGAKWKLAVVLDDVQLVDSEAPAVPLSVRSKVVFDGVSIVLDRALPGGAE